VAIWTTVPTIPGIGVGVSCWVWTTFPLVPATPKVYTTGWFGAEPVVVGLPVVLAPPQAASATPAISAAATADTSLRWVIVLLALVSPGHETIRR
jgi:hypothetical protein